MNTDRKRRTTKFGELDKLVNAEFEVLLAPGHQGEERTIDEAGDVQPDGADERVVYPHPFAERRMRPDENPAAELIDGPAAEVVDVKLQQKPVDGSLFSADEENFIASTSTWLRGRENADVVLDEIWRLVIGFDGEDSEQEPEQDVADEVEDVPEILTPDPVSDAAEEPSEDAAAKPKPRSPKPRRGRRKAPKDTKS